MARILPNRPVPKLARRSLLVASAAAVLLSGVRSKPAHAAQHAEEPILQPNAPGTPAFIERAFEMRQKATELDDQAYGAVVERDGFIIGQSWSRVILDQDPTGHAEMSAIRDAAMRLNSRDLSGAVMYSSSRPCPMCEAAAYWAGIDKMFHGREAQNAGAPRLCR